MHTHSRCFIESNGGLTVDRGRGIIHGVKILGLVSENGRRYLPSAVKAATRLYEGIKVNIDHPDNPGDTRSATDRIGKLVNVHYVEGKGLFGDFEVNAGHPFAEQLFYAAEHMPDIYGMSHNAQGDGEDVDGVFVVNKIVEVRSVDLVADPATTKALNESKKASTSESSDSPSKKLLQKTVELIRKKQLFDAFQLLNKVAGQTRSSQKNQLLDLSRDAKKLAYQQTKNQLDSKDLTSLLNHVETLSKSWTESKTVSGKNHILTESETNIARKAFADALGLIQSGKVPEAIELLSNMASGRLGISSERIKSVANQKANALIALNQYLKIMKKDLDNYSKTIKESVIETESKTVRGKKHMKESIKARGITENKYAAQVNTLLAFLNKARQGCHSLQDKSDSMLYQADMGGSKHLDVFKTLNKKIGQLDPIFKAIENSINAISRLTEAKNNGDGNDEDTMEADNAKFGSKAAEIIDGSGETSEKVAALVELVKSMYDVDEAEEPEMEYKDGEIEEAESSASDEVDTEEADAVHVDIGSHGGEDDAEMKEQEDEVDEEETEEQDEDEKTPMEAKESRRYITRLCRASRVKLSEQLVNDLKGLPRTTIQRQIRRIALAAKAKKPRSSIVATMTESKIPQGDDLFRWLRS